MLLADSHRSGRGCYTMRNGECVALEALDERRFTYA
jgi:hypothetical protein